MTDITHGIGTSLVEVTNISPYGVWILVGEEELFLPYTEFPWFKEASVGKICKVELHHLEHLYWPSLDIDLSIESIRNPAAFPLLSQ
jgi:Protein of unknown function (DUF2442)